MTQLGNEGVWATTSVATQVGAVTKYYYHGAARVAMRSGGAVSYLHGDHLGSTSLTTDANQNVVHEARYLPFGDERWNSGAGVTDYTYTGQRREGFNLHDYNARYYSSRLGRFVSADSIVPNEGDSQDFNRYSYVRNQPLNYVDPTGHCIPEGDTGDEGLCEPAWARDGDFSRKAKIAKYGRGIYRSDLTAFERFEKFLNYAADQYDTSETHSFMVDVTEVIYGHNADDWTLFFLSYRSAERNKRYWLDYGGFDPNYTNGKKCAIEGQCDSGWLEAYVDDSGNQAYHFWFYVATAYFDSPSISAYGNWVHDGPNSPDRTSEADYILGTVGVELGGQIGMNIAFVEYGFFGPVYDIHPGMPPLEIAKWVTINLGERPYIPVIAR